MAGAGVESVGRAMGLANMTGEEELIAEVTGVGVEEPVMAVKLNG